MRSFAATAAIALLAAPAAAQQNDPATTEMAPSVGQNDQTGRDQPSGTTRTQPGSAQNTGPETTDMGRGESMPDASSNAARDAVDEESGGDGAAAPKTAKAPSARPDSGFEGSEIAIGAFHDRDGNGVGGVTVLDTSAGALLTAQIEGLEPGEHGFHIHQTGQCDTPDFTSAGGHWAPEGKPHGYATEGGPHAGDMPNIFAHGPDGLATVHVFLDDVNISSGENPLLDEDGAAVIVHRDSDTYMSEAKAGERVACAALEPAGG